MALKERKWAELSREEKLASVLYPANVPEGRLKEMQSIAQGERKRPPQQSPVLSNEPRGAISPLDGRAKR
jgi:hypothetical protein